MKVFGNEPTALKLTAEAMAIYSNTDPLTITEKETAGGFRYDLSGVIVARDLTEAEVNGCLLELGKDNEK